MKKIVGFSLLELVVVIVVISLIAIIAIPKYIHIVNEAKKSSVESMAAGFSAAVISVRSQWEVARQSKMVDPLSNKFYPKSYNHAVYDETGFWLTDKSAAGLSDAHAGYPIGISSGGRGYVTTVTDSNCVELIDNLLQNPPVVLSVEEDPTGVDNIRYLAKAETNKCIYFQQEGAHNSFTYEIKTGRVTVNLQH